MRKFNTKKVNDLLMVTEKTEGYHVLINDSEALGFKTLGILQKNAPVHFLIDF